MDGENRILLQKFIEDRCTSEELLRVGELLQTQDGKALLDSLIESDLSGQWNFSKETPELNAKVNAWTKQLRDRIAAENVSTETFTPAHKKRFTFRYAAVWIGLLVACSFFIWQFNKDQELTYTERVNPSGVPLLFALPDSSHIYLVAGSKIRYANNFNDELREVTLEGEAFFDVERNPAKPFIINTDDIQTKVLGTSFKVEAFEGQSVIVSVATGKVGVSRHSENKIEALALLTPGQKVTWDKSALKATQGEVDVYSLEQWTAGTMVFDDKTMLQVAEELQRRYSVTLEFIDSEVALNKVRTKFPGKKPIEDVMEVLSAVGAFRYDTSDGKVYKIYKTE